MAISNSTPTQAVDALLKWKNTQSDSNNPQLLPQDEFIYLIVTLKKIPQKGGINGARTNPNKIPLPHPLITATSFAEICLIIDDRPNSKLDSQTAKKKIKEEGIPVTKVIKLSKLKTDYKPFEAKRKLCDSYEMFFADKRVIPLLPKLLGKQFFRKKKLPLPVELSHMNWKEQIEKRCSSALLFFRTGTCSVIRVAKASMERDEIIENVSAAINGVIEFVPKKLQGLRSLHLKFSESVALPLYQSLPDIKLRIEGVKENEVEEEVMKIEEVGKKKKRKKRRVHDVEEAEGEEDIENGVKPAQKSAKEEKGTKDDGGFEKKKRKGNVVEGQDASTKPGNKKAKKKLEEVEEEEKYEEVGKNKRSKKGRIHEVNHDTDNNEGEGEEIENNELGDADVLRGVKSAKKTVKEKKRKGNVVEGNGVTQNQT